MLDFNRDNNCYGCSACEYVCPSNAISMVENEEGFLVPKINNEKCIACGICEKKCPYLKLTVPEKTVWDSDCFVSFLKDESIRKFSASGGIATEISRYVVNNNGAVYGCIWNENLEAVHEKIDNLNDIYKLCGSKYVQSNILGVYEKIKMDLSNKKVLFIGTPCQVAAINNVFGNNPNLYTCGLICGGVASPKAWKMFKNAMEKKYSGKMISANMRAKGRYGWNSPIAEYKFDNNKKSEVLAFHLDKYVSAYLSGIFKRRCCFECGYKGNNINADIMVGDYWRSKELLKKSNNFGVSAVIPISNKGKYLFEILNNSCEIIETSIEDIAEKNKPLISSVDYHEVGNRKLFFKEIDKIGYFAAIKKYGMKQSKKRIIVFTLLDKFHLFEKVKRLMK